MHSPTPPPEPESFISWWAERELKRDWAIAARAKQRTPPGDWTTWLILAGRGWGKTRTGAEDVAAFGQSQPGSRIAVVAPTYADARDTCVEGESGLLSVLDPAKVQTWNRSLGELILRNGSRYKLFSAEQPDRLRGPQHHRAWADELAAWKYADTWDQLQFGLRLGANPQTVVTTTPKPVRLVRELLKRPDTHVTTGTTFENEDNLSPAALAQLKAKYDNTRLGQQELYAAVLNEAEGALWKRDSFIYADDDALPDTQRIVIAIDPAVTSHEDSDETGIIAVARGTDGRGYVLADVSGRFSPHEWASRAINLYHQLRADRIVAEVNNGGEMVEMTIRTVDPNVSYSAVRASRGKVTRAEPVAALYEQGRVTHCLVFPDLEDQLCNWTAEGSQSSPDRMDALVWGLTELMFNGLEQNQPPAVLTMARRAF